MNEPKHSSIILMNYEMNAPFSTCMQFDLIKWLFCIDVALK